MKLKHLDSFRSFLYTQYFSDGIKITIGVLLPSLLFFQFGLLEIGITLSLGAVCCSIADSPGPWSHRRNAMLITNGLVAIVALITALINYSSILVGAEILIFCFVFSMFYVYGTRASSVGTAVLLVMILNIDNHQSNISYYEHAFLILLGGTWYFLLSMLFSSIMPYRHAQQTLGECIQEIAAYLKLRADFYNANKPVEDIFKKLVDKQVKIHELQDELREILFKTRKLVNETTTEGRLLIIIFVDIVDLFEQTMATHHDYEIIRKKFKNYDVLPHYALLIHKLSVEIDYIGFCIIHQIKPRKHAITIEDLDHLKVRLDELEKSGIPVLVLKKILVNLRHIFSKSNAIFGYFDKESFINQPKSGSKDHDKFVNHQSFDLKLLKNNLNLQSSIFRYSLRLAIVAFIGFLVGKLMPVGHHGYWIILTILVILKPGFSTTKQRNYERVIGTIIGGISGALILYLIHDTTILFILMVIFMLITYSLQRVKYFISVIFMTPFILILFSFISTTLNQQTIAIERITDTLIGSGIAFLSSYLILPTWESYQFKTYMADTLKANLKYLEAIYLRFTSAKIDVTEYKLARKEVYVNTANLAAAFQRMLNEPKNKQQNASEIHKFVVLNHVMSSYLANLSTNLQDTHFNLNPDQNKLFKKTSYYLKSSISLIEHPPENALQEAHQHAVEGEINTNDLVTEQLELITKVSADILKITEKL